MIRLSAFADEISPDLHEQITVLKEQGIHYIDLRGVWDTNVLQLNDNQLADIKRELEAEGIGVAAIASPIGKVPVTSSFEEHLQHFERALEVARYLNAPYIRIFSFYPPMLTEATEQGQESTPGIDAYREEIIQRLTVLTRKAEEAGVTLIHENEKLIFGDTIARNVDLLKSINSPRLRGVLDPANYLQCEQQPYPEAYEAISPWLEYVHVKDVNAAGELVVAGAGDGRWPDILRRLRADGYDGFLSLEPHLAAAGEYQGFSGSNLFRKASQALQHLLKEMDWEYA
ncbi:sugar phosphate isomerase/epimerase family protein [Ktedonospora formicarum]|uniref:Xylose isomerase n=1 Tax=Ktedonospora formicarum TaxID=2778364 RepID=A0A8J3MQC0_9CHLR|nr:sugar phosphate isomerase/epimerase family protein [Ktedonospora formicarum]GHO42463.1 xylose isomerase [Ktedonospora formicarum]